MGWFFPVSKLVGFLILPSHVLLWLVLATAGAAIMRRDRAARRLAVAAAGLFLLIGVLPLGDLLARPIEDRYPRRPLPAHVDGVVTLGAGLETRTLMLRGAPGKSPSIDRLVSTYELARRYPDARIVFSGGWGPQADAVAARYDLERMGLAPGRLILEARSRNTYENLVFTRDIVKPQPGQVWVLATSAIQLPRAMAVARRLGWDMIPWPTDYLTAPTAPDAGHLFDLSRNLAVADEAVHEWIGLLAYRGGGMASGPRRRPA